MIDPVDTDALRDLLVIGAPPLSAPAAGHDKWIGQVRLAGLAAADEVDRLRTVSRMDAKVLNAFVRDSTAREARLRAVIENAPHADGCQWPHPDGDPEAYGNYCNCWKADAVLDGR